MALHPGTCQTEQFVEGDMIIFTGKKKQLREFLQFLIRRYGHNARVKNLPWVVCR
jgi:hypothetical protein